ncbi:hypothetical protein RJ641_030981 [Dillenia turbinata]|uniref:RING-type domain-containing protein n=1 Tax=Dillenia turbinata TaxID=194707 RepID=A0AAN8ZKH9_9MAGN
MDGDEVRSDGSTTALFQDCSNVVLMDLVKCFQKFFANAMEGKSISVDSEQEQNQTTFKPNQNLEDSKEVAEGDVLGTSSLKEPSISSEQKNHKDNEVLADGPKSKCNGSVGESSSTCGNSVQPTSQFSVGLQEATNQERFYGKVYVSKKFSNNAKMAASNGQVSEKCLKWQTPEEGSSGFLPSSFMLKGSDFEAEVENWTAADYYDGIPFDETLGAYVPQNEEDDLILKLAPKIDKLQNELREWKDWTSQYIRQATSTIKESKQMKLQLQEAERKEKKIMETSAKRLSETVSAVEYANSRLKKARETLQMLELENTDLKEKMEKARLQAEISDAKIAEWEEKEHTAMSEVESLEKKKHYLIDKIKGERVKVAEMQREVDKAESCLQQAEGRLKHEQIEKEKQLAIAFAAKKKREDLKAREEAESKSIKQKAEAEKVKHLELVVKLEEKLSRLNTQLEASKVAALKKSFEGEFGGCGTASGSASISGTKAMPGPSNRDEECVMCLFEKARVIFVPCGHKILCPACNEMHEELKFMDCPICRAPIMQRFFSY